MTSRGLQGLSLTFGSGRSADRGDVHVATLVEQYDPRGAPPLMARPILRIAAAATAVLLPLGMLAGCGQDAPEPTSEDPTSAEPIESDSMSPDEPTEPEPPAAMEKPNAAGAKAFVEYYFELLDYAAATGDIEPLTAIALRDCAACKGASNLIARVHKTGGHFVGGESTVTNVKASSRGELAQGVRPYDALAEVSTTRSQVRGTGDPDLDGISPKANSRCSSR